MDFPKASLEEYLKARAKCVDDFKKTVLGHDWREEQEEEIFFNPLFQYSCGVLYPRDTKHTNINLVSENEIDEEEFPEDTLQEETEESKNLVTEPEELVSKTEELVTEA